MRSRSMAADCWYVMPCWDKEGGQW
jgi:hypothetical protein